MSDTNEDADKCDLFLKTKLLQSIEYCFYNIANVKKPVNYASYIGPVILYWK